MVGKLVSFPAIAVVLYLAFTPASTADDLDNDRGPVVKTSTGAFRGKWVEVNPYQLPDYRARVAAYTMIPYAEPPVGDLRFRRPVPKVVEGDFDATRVGVACAQLKPPGVDIDLEVSEDCLYLDVFVPESKPSNAAVMVWIHGGGFQIGAGSMPNQIPIPLASMNDVIAVTLNYRLNFFGFLSTGDEEIPANIGLLDQRQALVWVQENIAAFGGDPSRVTIFGESAGACSAHFLLASPMCEGLFSRAILQSGVAGPKSNFPLGRTNKNAFSVGELLNCPTTTTTELAKCFREKTIDDFFGLMTENPMEMMNLSPRPAIFDEFLPNDPLAADAYYNPGQILFGFMADEGKVFVMPSLSGSDSKEKPVYDEAAFDGLVSMSLETDDELVLDMAKLIYGPTKTAADPEPNFVDAAAAVMGDLFFVCDGVPFINRMAENGRSVFAYLMTHAPSSSIWDKEMKWMGATHAEDIAYVFGTPFMFDVDDPDQGATLAGRFNAQEVEMAQQVMKYWTNFAKTGDPNLSAVDGDVDSTYPAWPAYTTGEGQYKDLSLTFQNLSEKLKPKECQFLRGLLPKLIENSAEMARLKSMLEERVNEDSGKSCEDPDSCSPQE